MQIKSFHVDRKLVPEGFYVDSLKEGDVNLMNQLWAQKYDGSEQFLKTAIRMNPSTGIYKNDGELVAWGIILETGAMGNLQVKGEYKRKEFGSIISMFNGCSLTKMGRQIIFHVVHQNEVSLNLTVNKHKGQWIGNNSWIGVKKRDKTELCVVKTKLTLVCFGSSRNILSVQ